MPPHRSYLVCATPRSGSTLLCESLNNTGIAGHPKEYFEALKDTGLPRRPLEYFTDLDNTEIKEHLGAYSRIDDEVPHVKPGSDYANYLAQVMEEGTTPNDVFSSKMMWGYLDDFVYNVRRIPAYQEMPVPQLLAAIFPNLRYIWVTRRDKVRQAVSLWKAIQTSTWRMEEPQHSKNEQVHKNLTFHFESIDHLVQMIVRHEASWQYYFAENDIQPLTIVYEELTQGYEATIHKILDYLDIPIPEDFMFEEPRMKRQADDMSEEWVQRYYAHT